MCAAPASTPVQHFEHTSFKGAGMSSTSLQTQHQFSYDPATDVAYRTLDFMAACGVKGGQSSLAEAAVVWPQSVGNG